MRQAILALLIIIQLEIACRSTTGRDFSAFVESLPSLSLPLTIECDFDSSLSYTTAIGPDSDAITKYDLGNAVFGRLNLDGPFVALLTGTNLARTHEYTVRTFTHSGQRLDSVYLGGACNDDSTSNTTHIVLLQSDGWIVDVTSLSHYRSFASDNPDSITSFRSWHYIDSLGHIKSSTPERHSLIPVNRLYAHPRR